MNKIFITGYLGKDPELKDLGDDVKLAKFSVGSSERGDHTEWFNIVCWRKTAEFVTKYFKKGSFIVITGEVKTRSWVDDDGQKHYMPEVHADNVTFGPKVDSGSGNDVADGDPPF